MKGWAVIVGILIFGIIISSGCSQPASSPSTVTTTSIQPTPLVTEQTSQPTPQPTVEVTKTQEKPLPLTEKYDGGSFSFKYPSGYGIYTVIPNTTRRRTLYFAKKEFVDSFIPNSIVYDVVVQGNKAINETIIDYDPLMIQSVLWVSIEDAASDSSYLWISNSLIHDEKGNTYWKTYDNAISEDVTYNNVKWVKVIDENVNDYYISPVKYADILKDHKNWVKWMGNIREKNLADFKPDIDIDIASDKSVDYFLRYRTPAGTMVWFEYNINAKWNGEPMLKDGFNEATFEEIVKSFTIVER